MDPFLSIIHEKRRKPHGCFPSIFADMFTFTIKPRLQNPTILANHLDCDDLTELCDAYLHNIDLV